MKFNKEQFNFDGMYLTYGAERRFVARFKRRSAKESFQAFLIKNFTVEEYFARIDAKESPLKIVEDKGYILPHIKRWLKERGYEVSKAGFEQWMEDQAAARAA
jgi:hypothetical protein